MITLRVTGTAITQGSKKGFYNKNLGRVQIVEDRKSKLGAWRSDVAAAARAAFDEHHLTELISAPIVVTLAFGFLRPRSHPKTRTTWPTGAQGDVDKLARAVLDAITGTLITDDKLVVELHVTKAWANPPGVVVTLDFVEAPVGLAVGGLLQQQNQLPVVSEGRP